MPNLSPNETSNLAECYMSVRTIFNGGKHYNRVQSGSFEGRCYAAGMRVQAGPTWQLETIEHILGDTPGKVSLHMTIHTNPTVCNCPSITGLSDCCDEEGIQVKQGQDRKTTEEYKLQCQAFSKYVSSTTVQHHYGPNSQQPDISPEELDHLCYKREVLVTGEETKAIERAIQQQSDSPDWYRHRRLRLTASNFGRTACRQDSTPVANRIKISTLHQAS